jgi:fucose 4-O-acetylase-like acetyltransferase
MRSDDANHSECIHDSLGLIELHVKLYYDIMKEQKEVNMKNNSRNYFIDMLKGIAVFLMMWGHCIQYCVAGSNVDFFENYMFKFIYSFHMPLFMLISGYLFYYSFSKRNLKELLVHRTQALLQPIIFCSIFNYFVTTALFGIIKGDFSVIFNGGWLNNLSSLWFLWSVLAASLVVAIVCKTYNKLYIQIILLIVAIPIIAIFPNRDMNLYMYPYFLLGFYFCKYKEVLPKIFYKLKYASLLLFPILFCFYQKKHFIYTTGLFPSAEYSFLQMLFIDGYRWLIGLMGSLFVIVLVELIYQYVIIKLKKSIVSNGLSVMGEKSIQFYVFSVPFLSTYLTVFFPKILNFLNIENIFIVNTFVYNFIFTFALSIAYAFALYLLIKLLDKLKIKKIMFGN